MNEDLSYLEQERSIGTNFKVFPEQPNTEQFRELSDIVMPIIFTRRS